MPHERCFLAGFINQFLSTQLTIVQLQKRYNGRFITQIGCLLAHRAACSFGNSGVRWNRVANFGLYFYFNPDSFLIFCTTPSPSLVLFYMMFQACALYNNWWPLLTGSKAYKKAIYSEN